MRLFKKYKECPDSWVIQSYIDGELNKSKLSAINAHLKTCNDCINRVEERKQLKAKVFDALSLLDENTNEQASSSKRENIGNKYHIKLLSVAATVFIVIGILTLMTFLKKDEPFREEQSCEWVVMDDPNFHPDFESPNRLYQMRAIAIAEVTEDGNVESRYLVKECKNN